MALLAGGTASAGAADSPAVIRRVRVEHHGAQVQVKIELSRPVTPQMSTASAPERVLLDFPNTSSSPHQHRIGVDKNWVKEVRYGLNQFRPPLTRLVVDLQRAGKYGLETAGTEITLTITPGAAPRFAAGSAGPGPGHRHAAPPAAASGVWIDFGKREAATGSTTVSIALPAPPESPGSMASASPDVAPSGRPSASSSVAVAAVPTPPAPTSAATAPAPPASPALSPATTAPANMSSVSTPPPLQPGAETSRVPQDSPSPQSAQPAPATASPIPAMPPATTANPATGGQTDAVSAATSAAGPSSPAASQTGPAEPQLSARPVVASAGEEAASPAGANADIRTVFRVKYVADGAVYLDGGRSDGLAEGVALVVKDQSPQPPTSSPAGGSVPLPGPVIAAHLKVISAAQNSAVCDISSSTREVKPGDLAYLTSADAEALVQQRALSSTRVYPQVITFTQGDPMDAEVRDEVPRPPLPEINRTRLMVGLDYGGISSRGAASVAVSSAQYGMVLRADMTRIGGTYWNLHGYWRGEMDSAASAAQPTMQDMINRTYTIGFTYDNPHSHFVAGVGRLYLPWATSLDVIDGGYGGVRIGKHVTTGLFAGTSPDPTSWSYNPDRRIVGNFVNFEGGSYEDLHFTSTVGMGVSTLLWQIDRPFVYLENGISYKRFISVYQAMQADKPRGTPAAPSPGAGISRSYVTVRVQPIERLSLDFNHNYFRDVPTYNLSLVGTGLLDTVLFQGFSAGARVETVKKIYLYTELGRSSRSGDTSSSLNQLYGITCAKLWNTGLHADLHYAKFNSPFAQGNYRAISLSRNFGDSFQAEVQVGKQAFVSPFTTDNGSKFVNASLTTSLGAHYFFAGGYNLQRGLVQNYDQWYFTLGYRFDNRSKVRVK